MNILFYEQGLWIGDTIMFFNLIQSLKYAFKNCTIWYLCQKASNDPYNTSLKEYGFDIKKIPNKIDDFGNCGYILYKSTKPFKPQHLDASIL